MSRYTKEERANYYRECAQRYLEQGASRKEAHKKAHEDCYEKFDVSRRNVRRSTEEYREGKEAYPEGPEDVGIEEEEEEQLAEKWVKDGDYHHDEDKGEYLIHLNAAGRIVTIPEETMQDIFEWYSNWNGNADTINQICQKIGFPRQWFSELRRKMGLTHDREPFTPEEITSNSTEQLVDDLLQKRRNQLAEEWESERLNQLEREAKKWRKIEQRQLDPLKDALQDIQMPDPADIEAIREEDARDEDRCAVLCLQDLHFGERGHESDFSIDKMEDRFHSLTERLLERIADVTIPQKLYVALLGDIFHIDTENETTSWGTQMEASAGIRKIYKRGSEAITKFLERCRKMTDVELIGVDGNHDRLTSFALVDRLQAVYGEEDGGITVRDGSYDLQFASFGENLFAFSHGDRYRKSDKSKIFAREAKELWAETSTRYWFEGHMHSEDIDSSDATGAVKVVNPSPAPKSDFERKKGYSRAQKGLNAYVFDSTEGRIHMPSVRVK